MSLAQELNFDLPIQDLHHEAVLSIVRTSNLLATLGAGLFRRFHLTEAQFNVLLALKYKKGAVTQSDLGKRLVISRASVTSVLDKLEEKELIERKRVEGNRRIYHIEPTDEGVRVTEEVEPLYRDMLHQVMSGLDEAQCRRLVDVLERVRKSTKKNQQAFQSD